MPKERRNEKKDSRSFTRYDEYLYAEGTAMSAYRKLGAHPCCEKGTAGVRFAVWAPAAKNVCVITSGDGWQKKHPLTCDEAGFWEAFVPGPAPGDAYRFVVSGADGIERYKADPFAFQTELRPANASVIAAESTYKWHDAAWMRAQAKSPQEKPMAIYEVHPGSWKKDYSQGPDGFLNYRQLGEELAAYVTSMGFTHVELMGIAEHPLDGSWGYQVTGYYSPTSRYGSPDDLRAMVDTLHRAGIGVIFDWVPAHFPRDDFGLRLFDGTPLYEYEDPLRAEYPEWGTMAFDFGKGGVRSFLLSNVFYWIREFHADALRVDAVAALLYNSFGRQKWRPNRDGGMENLESIAFLKQLNTAVREQSHAYLIAEDSSILAGVTAPAEEGGLGFGFKWNMGWMNETLAYLKEDPLFRRYHHAKLTHPADYAFTENFVLPLSHDEVVHLKAPLLQKSPGLLQDRFGALKALLTYQMTSPGKKLLFMGQEFGEDREWSEERALDWNLLDEPGHRDVSDCLRDLLQLYRKNPVLYTDVREPKSFEWVTTAEADRNIISYIRRNPWNYEDSLLVVLNFSTVETDFASGVGTAGKYRRVFSTYDHLEGCRRKPVLQSREGLCNGRAQQIRFKLRAYEGVIFRKVREK